MPTLNLWEHQNEIKTLYSKCVDSVCEKHRITRMELDILLFLANNPMYDTATDIVDLRMLAKSQVSISVKALEGNGYIKKEYAPDNRKTAHLKICEDAWKIIDDGRKAQEDFLSIAFQGISKEDIEIMKKYYVRISENIHHHLRVDNE